MKNMLQNFGSALSLLRKYIICNLAGFRRPWLGK